MQINTILIIKKKMSNFNNLIHSYYTDIKLKIHIKYI